MNWVYQISHHPNNYNNNFNNNSHNICIMCFICDFYYALQQFFFVGMSGITDAIKHSQIFSKQNIQCTCLKVTLGYSDEMVKIKANVIIFPKFKHFKVQRSIVCEINGQSLLKNFFFVLIIRIYVKYTQKLKRILFSPFDCE